jgi:lysophospholipase L1-like esterase
MIRKMSVSAVHTSRRGFLGIAAVVVLGLAPIFSGLALAADDHHWVGTWSTAPLSRTSGVAFNNLSLRQIVRVSLGGSEFRVKFSNSFGTQPLTIGAARLALRDAGSAIIPSSDRQLTFEGNASTIIPPGAHVLSDTVHLRVPALSDLAISTYLPGAITASPTSPVTGHTTGLQTSYVAAAGSGNHTADLVFPTATTTQTTSFLMGVDVNASRDVGAVVTLGDSITDGTRSTPDTNNRWPNQLARRLLGPNGQPMGVLNMGISGNRVISDGAGVNAQARFDRDVLAQSGVTHVIVLEGINDSSNAVFQADQIIAGLHQLAERAHEKGLKIYAGTLTPAGFNLPTLREQNRQAVNAWIRSSGAFDAVIEFDTLTRDPANPGFFLPLYDSGDHLHPNDAGYQAMGNFIDLELLQPDSSGN